MRRGFVALLVAVVVAACSSVTSTQEITIVTPAPTLVFPSGGLASIGAVVAGPSGSAATSSGPSAPASVAAPSASSGPSGSAAPSPESAAPSVASAAPSLLSASPEPSCTPEAPTGLSASWKTWRSHSGDFSLATPSDWVDHHGLAAQTYGDIMDPGDLTASGLDPKTVETPDLIGSPGGLPGPTNVRVFMLPNFTVPLELVRSRLAAWYVANPVVTMAATDLAACLSGTPALGFDMTFGNGANLEEVMLAERGSTGYVIEWATKANNALLDVLAEILRTWQWTGAQGPTGTPATSATTSPGASGSEAAVGTIPNPTRIPATPRPTLKPGQTPGATPINIGPLLTASLAAVNDADTSAVLDLSIIDDSGKPQSVSKQTLLPLDFTSQKVPPASFKVTITLGNSAPVVCTVKAAAGDAFTFAITTSGVLIASPKAKPTSIADMRVPTSPLCGK